MLLLAGGRLGHSAQFHQDFLLAEDQILLVVDLDVVAGVLAKQDPVAHLYVQRDAMALFHLAGSDGHYFALLRLFFSRIGDNDPAFRGFFLFQPAYEDAVMQRSDIHSHSFDLRSIHSKTRTTNFCGFSLGQHYGRKLFWFFCRITSRSSVCFFRRSASRFGPSCLSSL